MTPSDPFSHLVEGTPPPAFLLVVSGPSGVGKTVLCERLLAEEPALARSVSATTRPRRDGERDGADYFFREEAAFRRGIEAGEFLEWAEVHDHLYGTPAGPVDAMLARGITPVLNIDVQGGRSVKRLRPEAVLVFLTPPSAEELEARLRGRGTDDEGTIALRLRNARRELEEWSGYDYLVVNADLDAAVASVRGIVAAERARIPRIRGEWPG